MNNEAVEAARKSFDERDQKILQREAKKLEFVECDTCRKKPGMPTLCQGCLINRRTISKLKARIKVFKLKEKLAEARRELQDQK